MKTLHLLTAIATFAVLASAAVAAPEDAAPAPDEEITVTETRPRETRPVGAHRQPEWTARRRFANADVYVQPPWQVEVAAGYLLVDPNKKTGGTLNRFRQELEVGLPYRLQADIELQEDLESGDGRFDSVGVELRYAFADWGVIPFNPAIYGEWEFRNEAADEFEIKLIGGTEVDDRIYTAVNLFYGHQVGDERETEFAISNAWSYSLIDQVLGVGAEIKVTFEKEEDLQRDGTTKEEFEGLVALGPSAQWRFTEDASLVAAPLFGLTDKSPDVEVFVALRVYFGGEDEDEGMREAPSSMDAR